MEWDLDFGSLQKTSVKFIPRLNYAFAIRRCLIDLSLENLRIFWKKHLARQPDTRLVRPQKNEV
jgi:hypothetical protein